MLTAILPKSSQFNAARRRQGWHIVRAEPEMHIVAIVVAVVVGVAVWWWRLKMVAQAGSDIIDQVGKVRGAVRRYNFRKTAETSVISSIQDPAIAATVFLFTLANQKVAFLDDAKERITNAISTIVSAADVSDVIGFGEWVANSVAGPEDPLRRFKPLWLDRLDRIERDEFLEMARVVASAGNGPTLEQEETLASLARAFGH